MTRTGWTCGRGLLGGGCGGGGAFFKISADVIERFCGVFNGLPHGGVDGGDFLLDAEAVTGKVVGDVQELAGDDVSNSRR